MQISHTVPFSFNLILSPRRAVAFVRDVEESLQQATFIKNMQVQAHGDGQLVQATIPVNAALFGQHDLAFRSLLTPTERGAKLVALELETEAAGWAEVAGEADVSAIPGGSRVTYTFDVTIHLNLPEPEKWGGRALMKMIHYTAQRVLENIVNEFPKAVQAAAAETEATISRA